jgi:hypothetical protein
MATTLDGEMITRDADAGERPTAARPLALTNDQMTAILRAAEPLQPDRRDAFVRELNP